MDRHAAQQRLRGSINHRMPPFPCTVLFYSKDDSINGFRINRFEDQASFDKARTMSVAMVRVLLGPEDLADVPDRKLRFIYNKLTPAEQLDDSEIPREELQGLAFGAITNPSAATPYEDKSMTAPDTTAPANPDEAKTKAEAKALELKQKRDAKEKEKADAKAAAAAKRADGVIGTIKAALDTNEGTTATEVLDKLVQKFPDRTREGMSSTVKIQFSRLAKSQKREIINEKIKGRGRVYKFADKGAVPGEVEAEAPAPAPTTATPATPAAAAPATPAPAAEVPAATPATPPAKTAPPKKR